MELVNRGLLYYVDPDWKTCSFQKLLVGINARRENGFTEDVAADTLCATIDCEAGERNERLRHCNSMWA